MMMIEKNVMCIPRHTFVAPKWTVTGWFFGSSRMNWSATIGRGYSDEMNRHDSVAMSAITMSFGDLDLMWRLPCHVISRLSVAHFHQLDPCSM
jgi:hypothetical protein